MEFSEFFKELLNEFGVTQAQLSRQTGIPKTTISGWLNAGRLPDYNSLRALCAFFQISGDEILRLDLTGESKISNYEALFLEKYRNSSDEVKSAVRRLLNL